MKKEEFIDLFADIDEDYILKAHESRKKGKVISSKKWFAIIAAIIILGATATGVIAEVFNIKFDITPQKIVDENGDVIEHSRYGITYRAENVPKEEFSEEIRKSTEELNEAWKTHLNCDFNNCSEHGELSVSRKFVNISEALEYIGCERIEIPDLNTRVFNPRVSVLGSYDLYSTIMFYWACENTEIDFTCSAEINVGKKDENKEKRTGRMVVGEKGNFSEERRINKNGLEYIVVYSDKKEGYFSEYYDRNTMEKTMSVTAYIVKNDILYVYNDSISELYNKDGTEVDEVTLGNIRKREKEVVEKYLELWADSF